MNKKVLVFGTFDGLHEGHKSFLKQASELGKVTVVVGRDSTVLKIKGKLPKFNENDRLKAMQECQWVSEARLGNEAPEGQKLDPYRVINEVIPDVICLGYDQTHFVDKLQAKLEEMHLSHIQIHRLSPYHPEKYHSSIINNNLE